MTNAAKQFNQLQFVAKAGRAVEAQSGIDGVYSFAANDVIAKFEIPNAAFSPNGEGGIVVNAAIQRAAYDSSPATLHFKLLLYEEDITSESGLVKDSPFDVGNTTGRMPFGIYEFDQSDTASTLTWSSTDGDVSHGTIVKAKNPEMCTWVCPQGTRSVYGVLIAVDAYATADIEILNVQISIAY